MSSPIAVGSGAPETSPAVDLVLDESPAIRAATSERKHSHVMTPSTSPAGKETVDHGTPPSLTPNSAASEGKGAGRKFAPCQVKGCVADLTKLREYNQRFKICSEHQHAETVMRGDEPLRFCQQCARLQPLADFDGKKRSCRISLEQLSVRRRKQKKIRSHDEAGAQGGSAVSENDGLLRRRRTYSDATPAGVVDRAVVPEPRHKIDLPEEPPRDTLPIQFTRPRHWRNFSLADPAMAAVQVPDFRSHRASLGGIDSDAVLWGTLAQLQDAMHVAHAEIGQLRRDVSHLEGMVRHRDEMLERAQAEMQEIRNELQAQGSHTALLAREWDGHLNKSKSRNDISTEYEQNVEELSAEVSYLRAQLHGDRAKALEERKLLLGKITSLKRSPPDGHDCRKRA
uniref:SBP-type domain-containing protein n=1 Tax=Tetraselmis chuii TaxID=63592 RepID=A0A7S1SVW9_9CHLO|mmetsp:Transcript_32353/g.57904  ORF Transcript_32353/g.57904 Transcript_32353/m.57904 type:complete len:398 (+) Transcript_32353:336-1529(+)